MLYEKVVMYTAERLIGALTDIQTDDGAMQYALDELRIDLSRRYQAGTPWVVADELDAVASLDIPVWAVLVCALGECPVMHAVVGAARRGARSVSPQSFEFIAENSQIAEIREYLRSLPDTLIG